MKQSSMALRPCRGGEAIDGFGQLALVQPGEAESGERDQTAVERVSTARIPEDAALETSARPGLHVDRSSQAHP